MTQLPPVQLAEIGYETYGQWVGGKNDQGLTMPSWAALPDPQRMAWIAAAQSIERTVLAPPLSACATCGHSGLFHDRGEDGKQPPACCFVACGCGKTGSDTVVLDGVTQSAVEG